MQMWPPLHNGVQDLALYARYVSHELFAQRTVLVGVKNALQVPKSSTSIIMVLSGNPSSLSP